MTAAASVDERKSQEVGHYEEKARHWRSLPEADKWERDVHGLRHDTFLSYGFFHASLAARCRGKRVLDYGCGTGIHSLFPVLQGGEVTGIDLSLESLAIARERLQRAGFEKDKVSFVQMDCERLDFPDSSFDLVIDGGTFSSLDLDRALPEIARVLGDDGCLIGIETFGHNPLTNLKRRLNVLRGVRTAWASRHILKAADLEKMKRHFRACEVRYFHLLSVLALPFAGVPGGRHLVRLLDRLDSRLLTLPFLRNFAFKVVFVFSRPLRSAPHAQTPA